VKAPGPRLRRLVLLLLGILAVWLVPVAPAGAHASQGRAYIYDVPDCEASGSADAQAHSPPVRGYPAIADNAADLSSGDAPACLEVGAVGPTTTYAMGAQFVRITRATATTQVPALAADSGLIVPDRVGVAANTGRLTSRADELSGVLDPIARNSRTSAVLGTRQGRDVLAGGGRDLSPAQRALARDGDVIARGPGLHAEVTAVNGARGAGLTPRGIGVSRPICPACISFLEDAGATITSPFSAWWY